MGVGCVVGNAYARGARYVGHVVFVWVVEVEWFCECYNHFPVGPRGINLGHYPFAGFLHVFAVHYHHGVAALRVVERLGVQVGVLNAYLCGFFALRIDVVIIVVYVGAVVAVAAERAVLYSQRSRAGGEVRCVGVG